MKITIPIILQVEDDPKTYKEAMSSRDATFWKETINDEMDSIMSNHTWKLVDLPSGSKYIGCKWVFRRKYYTDGTLHTFKARLVAKGFRQKEGIDYFDTYAPVARITSIRILFALASIHDIYVHQMDVKTVGTMGLGLTTPANRPRSTEDHRMMAQSTGQIVFIYKSGPNIHPQPGKAYTAWIHSLIAGYHL